MTHGRFKNPVEATLTGIKDIFRTQALAKRLQASDRLDGKVCLITGANSGLGFATAVEFAQRGAYVLMACRSQIPEAGEKVKKLSKSEKVEMLKVDLADIQSIINFCQDLHSKNIKLDIVVLNAGVTPPKARLTPQGLDEMFMVNYLANYIIIRQLTANGVIPSIASTQEGKATIPRIIFISSDSHQGASAIDFSILGQFENYGVKKAINNYSYFKLILNTLAVELSRRLNPNEKVNVSVNAMCPGPVNTNIIRDAPWILRVILRFIFTLFFQSPTKAAQPIVYLAASPDWEGKTQEYLHIFNHKPMDEKCYDVDAGSKLWEASEKIWHEALKS
jgi:NAD(P)-dependent dehydrogenase (short-subunit alcohol dehydrogenase family)